MKQTHILNIMFGVHILFQYLIREANVFPVFLVQKYFIYFHLVLGQFTF